MSVVQTFSVSADKSDEANLKLYKIASTIRSDKKYYDHRYTLCGTFSSWSDARDYFTDTHSITTEVLTQNIVPENKYWEQMNFGSYRLPSSGFSFIRGCLCISVETDQGKTYYMLLDISTYKSEEISLEKALNEIVSVKWSNDNEYFSDNFIKIKNG